MGISSTGILYWGLDFGEHPPWDELGEDPHEEVPEDGDFDSDYDDCLDPNDLIWKANGAKESDSYAVKREAAKDLGVEIILHCSYDYSMWGLGVSESVSRASRGYPIAIKELIIKPEWEVMLWIAREKLGWTDGDPSWHLTSVYG